MDENQAGASQQGVSEQTQEEITPASQPDSSQEDQGDSQSSGADEGEGRTGTTDRGTQVAKEPESKFYQQLKNENADMRRLLGDPNALKEYMRQFEGTQAPKAGEEDDLSDIATKVLDENGQVDLAKFAQFMEERTMKKLETAIQFHTQNQIRSREIETTYNGDKSSVRSEHPELDPKSDKFDGELEQFVGERFIAQGGLEGKVTLKQVVDSTYAYLSKVRGSGRQQAETEIVRKRAGAIPQPRVQGEAKESEEGEDPAAILSARIQKAVAGK